MQPLTDLLKLVAAESPMADFNCKLTPICHIRMISQRPSELIDRRLLAFALTSSLAAERSAEKGFEGSFVRWLRRLALIRLTTWSRLT